MRLLAIKIMIILHMLIFFDEVHVKMLLLDSEIVPSISFNVNKKSST